MATYPFDGVTFDEDLFLNYGWWNNTVVVNSVTYRYHFGLLVAAAREMDNRLTLALTDVSTTSLAIGTGSKTFTASSGKSFRSGQFVTAASAAAPANYMFGQVTSYSGTTLIVNVTAVGGSGTLSDWNISVSGARGATGATGPGDVNGPASSTDGNAAVFSGMGGKTLIDAGFKPMGQGKHALPINATSLTSRPTSGAAAGSGETSTNKVVRKSLDFDSATAEYAQITLWMPKSWNEGTVTAQFVWSHASTATNFGVVWGIQAVALSNDDALDTAFGTGVTVADTGGTTDDIYTSDETGAITIGGSPAENDFVVFQIYRLPTDGSDTLAVDARLHSVKLFLTTNAATDA